MSGTVVAMRPGSPAPVAARPTASRVGLRDLWWLTWRQHRWSIVLATVVTLAAAIIMLVLDHRLIGYGQCGYPYPADGHLTPAQSQCVVHRYSTGQAALSAIRTVVWLPTGIALLWAVPLLAREYETGTIMLAWGQDVSPRRWVATKAAALLLTSLLLTAALAVTARALNKTYLGLDNSPFTSPHFETGATVLLAYTLLAFAVGLASGFLVRRTLPALVSAAIVFTAIRYGLRLWRPHYQSPASRAVPIRGNVDWTAPGDLALSTGRYGNAAGHFVRVGNGCSGRQTLNQHYVCLRRKYGATDYITIYQPAHRLHLFQLIEAGLCTLPALMLLILVVNRVRRGTLSR